MDFISYDSDDEIDVDMGGDGDVDDSFYSDDDISGSEFKSSMRASWKEENTNTEHSDLNSYRFIYCILHSVPSCKIRLPSLRRRLRVQMNERRDRFEKLYFC